MSDLTIEYDDSLTDVVYKVNKCLKEKGLVFQDDGLDHDGYCEFKLHSLKEIDMNTVEEQLEKSDERSDSEKTAANEVTRLLDVAKAHIIVVGGGIDIERLRKMTVMEFFGICVSNGIGVNFDVNTRY